MRDKTAFLCCTARVKLEMRGEAIMSMVSHVEELKRKHQILSAKVEEVQRSPGSSDFEISDLKKQKLKLKEEIERLSVTV